MQNTKTAYIGIGSNLGDRKATIAGALKLLAQSPAIEVVRTSEFIETIPLTGADQPDYLNTVAEIKTTLSAEDFHKKMADVETALARVRNVKWSPRTIDLDLLLFGEEIINVPDLIVPHQQMHLRSFVLTGLCELNPELRHPVIKKSMKQLAARLNGADFFYNPSAPQLVSVAGLIGVGKTTLTTALSGIFNGESIFEPYDTNPFMPAVYAGKKEMALDSELYFLTSRAEQLKPDVLAYGKVIVSDYVFDKTRIYANRWLDKQQLDLYDKIYAAFGSIVASPVLVIYMRGSIEQCLERIHKRNRPYEQQIEPKFLETLDGDYERFFAKWKASPVIRIDVSEFDCTDDSDMQNLAEQVKNYVVT